MHYPTLKKSIIPAAMRRVTVTGIEHVPQHGPYLVAANHQSYNDAVELTLALVTHRDHKPWYPTTEHVWRTFSKFGGQRVLTWLGMIPILTSNKAEALAPALQVLRAGGVIGIFPEGGRNKPKVNPEWDRVLLKGKTGAVRLALTIGCPIVPAGIVAPKGFGVMQAIVNFLRRSQPASVTFGEPLMFPKTDPSAFTHEMLTTETARVMRAIAVLCNKEYRH